VRINIDRAYRRAYRNGEERFLGVGGEFFSYGRSALSDDLQIKLQTIVGSLLFDYAGDLVLGLCLREYPARRTHPPEPLPIEPT